MASMKPLFTITVLLVVGVYLYKTINEGPARPHAAQGAADQSAAGIPPLAAAGGAASLAQDKNAPAWPANAPNAGPVAPVLPPAVTPVEGNGPPAAAPQNTTASADPSKAALPEVPPIPELPELPKTSDTAVAGTAPMPLAATATPAATPVTPVAPALPPATPEPAAQPEVTPLTNSAQAAAPAAAPVMPPATSATPAVAPPITPIPPAAAQSAMPATPAPSSPAAVPMDDRYGQSATTSPPAVPPTSPAPAAPPTASAPPAGPPITPVPAAPTAGAAAPAAATFAASWPTIQAALDKNDLKQAHQLLSKWHGDETLSPTDAQRVESLLGQLAGTVIYSNEHRLEPPRVVKAGETLESVAKEYNVPWQLLAKINSIQGLDQVRPGQELKVVRGPFSAVVDLHRNELTLEVDGRYAGTFNVTVPPGAAVTEGQWTVDQKVAGQPSAAAPAAYAAPPSAADRAIVLRNVASAQPGGPTLTITSGTMAAPPSAGAVAIQVAPQDAEDLSDILSIGSRVVVRK